MNFKTSDDDLIKVTNLEARMRGTTPVIMSFTPKSTNLEIKNISFEKELNKIKKTLDFSDNSSAKQEDDWENSISTLPYETKNYETQRNYEENFELKKKIAFLENELNNIREKERNKKADLIKNIEINKRKTDKLVISLQKYQLGDYVKKKVGKNTQLIWIDGYEIEEIDKKIKKIEQIKSKLQITLKSYNSQKIKKKKNLNEVKLSLFSRLRLLSKEQKSLYGRLSLLEESKINLKIQILKQENQENSYFGEKLPLLNSRYQIINFEGRGGFSEVYKVFDLKTDEYKALKLHRVNSNGSEHYKACFLNQNIREAKILKSLNHDNIIKFHEIIKINEGILCSILEYCEGNDLWTYIQHKKQLKEKEIKDIIRQILFGVKFIHQNSIVHHDLKPQNILFHQGLIKIIDFGLCRLLSDPFDIFSNYSQLGTYWYLPPECFLDKSPTYKIDIWSIGIICYEMLFGCKPFANDIEQEIILKEKLIVIQAKNLIFPEKNISDFVKEFIQKCLEYDPSKRWNIDQALESNFLK